MNTYTLTLFNSAFEPAAQIPFPTEDGIKDMEEALRVVKTV